MIFKILAIGIIFFLARNTYRSWLLFQKLQETEKKKQRKQQEENDDPIDAEYTVLDK